MAARITGSVLLVERKSGPVFYLKARDRHGRQIKRRLGPAHTGRGRAPEGSWTRRQADDELRAWLTDLGHTPDGPEGVVTLGAAVRAWLHYLEHERERAPSTLRDYRNIVNASVLRHFGEDRPLASVDTEAVDEFRRHLLGVVSRRTAQKTLVLLFGLLTYATRRKWIATDPAAHAERVTARRRPELRSHTRQERPSRGGLA